MTRDQWESLLDQDWSEAWDTLPDAPDLVARPKTAQITLRLPMTLVARIKRVAKAQSLPYHALARSWVMEGLRQQAVTDYIDSVDEPQLQQLNLKLDQKVLDALKARGHELRRPYHRLGRELIEQALVHAESSLGLATEPTGPAIKDLMVLLLHATDRRGHSTVRGITRLQKLLFVIEQKLASESNFYAFNYGPFNEEVNDAVHALQLAGLLQDAQSTASEPPSFAEMMATVSERSGPRDQVAEFELSERGHEAAEKLCKTSSAYEQLYRYVRSLREEWDTPDLLERVYETWPKFAEKSHIREEVAARRARRRSD